MQLAGLTNLSLLVRHTVTSRHCIATLQHAMMTCFGLIASCLLGEPDTGLATMLQELRHAGMASGGYAVLTSLSRLERLSLAENRYLPACLPQLTTLSELRLQEASKHMPEAAASAAVNAALQQLTQVSSSPLPWMECKHRRLV